MERQNFCQKLYGIKQKAFRATFVNRWSSSSSSSSATSGSSSISGILSSKCWCNRTHSVLNVQIIIQKRTLLFCLCSFLDNTWARTGIGYYLDQCLQHQLWITLIPVLVHCASGAKSAKSVYFATLIIKLQTYQQQQQYQLASSD